jgi:hypothetical protein
MAVRIIKENSLFYIEELIEAYTFWFKKTKKWERLKKWYQGSYYFPYSEDTYDDYFFPTIESAEKYLCETNKCDCPSFTLGSEFIIEHKYENSK